MIYKNYLSRGAIAIIPVHGVFGRQTKMCIIENVELLYTCI